MIFIDTGTVYRFEKKIKARWGKQGRHQRKVEKWVKRMRVDPTYRSCIFVERKRETYLRRLKGVAPLEAAYIVAYREATIRAAHHLNSGFTLHHSAELGNKHFFTFSITYQY